MASKNKQKCGHQESSTSSDKETLAGYASRIPVNNWPEFLLIQPNGEKVIQGTAGEVKAVKSFQSNAKPSLTLSTKSIATKINSSCQTIPISAFSQSFSDVHSQSSAKAASSFLPKIKSTSKTSSKSSKPSQPSTSRSKASILPPPMERIITSSSLWMSS